MTTGTTTPQAVGLHADTLWRSCDRPLHVPMVEIPRDLALDLLRVLSIDDFLFTMPDADLKQDCFHGPPPRWSHRRRRS